MWQLRQADTPQHRQAAHQAARAAIRLAWALLGRGEPPAGWWDHAAMLLLAEQLDAPPEAT